MPTVVRDTRQLIVLGAIELFRSQGYAATSVQQVAERAGISKGNLTYHFPSKQVLFVEAMRQVMDYVSERVLERSFTEAPGALEGVEAFLARVRRWLLHENGHFVGCVFTNIAIETRYAEPAIAELALASLIRLKDRVERHLAEGQATGAIRADYGSGSLAAAFFWMYEGALTVSRAQDDPAEFDRFRHGVRALLLPP